MLRSMNLNKGHQNSAPEMLDRVAHMVKGQGLFWRSEDASLLGSAINYARYLEVLGLVHQRCVMRLHNL